MAESTFDNLLNTIDEGMSGKNNSIPIGLPKLGRYANLRKKILTLMFSTTGAGKCFSPGTKVLMHSGVYKTIENIVVGDLVMGIDSKPRKVLEVHNGIDNMFKITQNKGITYTVNKEHILALKKRENKQDNFLEISVKETLEKNRNFLHVWKGYKLEGIDFKEELTEIDPYFLGLWLGDGTARKCHITTADEPIVEYLKDFCIKNNLLLIKETFSKYSYSLKSNRLIKQIDSDGKTSFWNFIKEPAKQFKSKNAAKYISNVLIGRTKKYKNHSWEWVNRDNCIFEYLKSSKLISNKHIPDNYLINSRKNRLKLLAGLLDSDGHYQKKSNGYEITQKNKNLAEKIVFLSRSLGFYTSIKEKKASLKRIGKDTYTCQVYRIGIYGSTLGEIPCILDRKKAYNTTNKKINPLTTGITIKPVGQGAYYGFSLDGDGLFLLEDFTVAHNSAMIDTIVLNACDNYLKNPSINMKPDFQLFSMERSKEMRIAKWVSYIIFKNEGEILSLPKMLGWWADEKLTKAERSLIASQKDYIDTILNDYVTIHEGAKTPNEIYRIMKDHFEAKGEYDEESKVDPKTSSIKKTKVYNSKEDRTIIIPIFDHGNLFKTTKDLPTKKASIDKAVEYVQGFRDLEGSSPIWVSQVNRSISGVTRSKDSELELVLEDVKESGDIGDACDIAISLFDPVKYNQGSKTGYTPTDFVDKNNGNNYFRSAQILKSSYGADNLRIPLAFNGFCGQFKELPKRSDLNDIQYQDLLDDILAKKYFLKS